MESPNQERPKSRDIRQSAPDTTVFLVDSTKEEKPPSRRLTKSKSAKLRKSICLDFDKAMSSPRNTIKMTDEEKIQFIKKANTLRKPTPKLEAVRTGTGPVQYRRKESKPDIGDQTKTARSCWQARDESEIDVNIGDKLFFYAVESGWVLGSVINDDDTIDLMKKGWFPLDVLLAAGRSPTARLEVMSFKSNEPDISDSIIENKKRFALRLENFTENRPPESFLMRKNILTAKFSESMESYASIPRPPPLPELPLTTQAIHKFNRHARKGVEFIIANNVLGDNTPKSIALFLMNSKLINKHVLGDYLGEAGDMNCDVRDKIFDFLDFTSLEYDMALRRFLDVFHLPGEAQKIDRLMQAFAKKFFTQHDGSLFNSADAAYVLAFSTVMLNTDLHNPSIKKKMTKEQFISQNRGVNEGENFPREFLEDLYEVIVEDELKGHNVLPGALKRGWLGLTMNKSSSSQRTKRSWVMMDKNGIYCFKSQQALQATCTIPLRIIDSFKKTKPIEFRIKTRDKKTYLFTTKTERSLESWIRAMSILQNRQPK